MKNLVSSLTGRASRIHSRGLWSASCLLALPSLAFAEPVQSQVPDVDPQGFAEVYRDQWGVPHIVADDEEAAWYALGYEEARDALYWVQFNLRLYTGESARFQPPLNKGGLFGKGTFVENDALVRLVGANLEEVFNGNLNTLRAFLSRDAGGVGAPNQVYRNLKAYAEGLDDYRKRLDADVGLDPLEQAHRAWLAGPSRAWALTEEITVWDTAGYGPWVQRKGGVGAAQKTDLAQFCDGSALAGSSTIPIPPAPEDPFHEELPGQELEGSVGFCWSRATGAGNGVYSGAMADAQGNASRRIYAETGGGLDRAAHHRWFAHLIVPPKPGVPEDPGINCYGWMHHGAGMLQAFHNESIAFGGSMAVPNRGDGFLLRLQQDGNGDVVDPITYFSYYDNAGNPDAPWEPLVYEELEIPNGTPMPETVFVYRAGRFGFALPPVNRGISSDEQVESPGIFWAEDTTDWAAGVDPATGGGVPGVRNDFYCDKPTGVDAIPVVVSLRVPGDPRVHASEPFPGIGRLAVGVYEIMRARSVYDFQEQAVLGNLGRGPATTVVDRDGRVFALVQANIVRRGHDALLEAAGYSSLDKFDIYDTTDSEPVPARWASDEMFDWSFDSNGQARYLKPKDGPTEVGDPSSNNPDYLAYILFDPVDPENDHPQPVAGPGYENPGFAMGSNDFLQYFYKKDLNLGPKPPGVGSVSFNVHWDADNQVMNNILEAGTMYSDRSQRLSGATDRTRYVIDAFRAGIAGDPTQSIPDALQLAWDNRRYVETEYSGYVDENGTPVLLNRTPPLDEDTAVVRAMRELKGIRNRITTTNAKQEIAFFEDLWTCLWRGDWDNYELQPGIFVDLKDVWIDNTWPNSSNPQVFWFPSDPANPTVPGTQENIDMPTDFALIDFLWSEVRMGKHKLPAVYGVQKIPGFDDAVSKLETWKNEEFAETIPSLGAALAQQFEVGLLANKNGIEDGQVRQNAHFHEGRMWSPVSNGRVLATGTRYPSANWMTNLSTLDLVNEIDQGNEANSRYGVLPSGCDVDAENRFDMSCPGFGDEFLLQFVQSYKPLDMIKRFASLLTEHPGAGQDHPIVEIPLPPYDALYSDVATRTVKDISQLSREDINALVSFFLNDLGRFGLVSGGGASTSRKKESVDAWWANPGENPFPWSRTYPLTRNIARITLMQRLVEADEFNMATGIDEFGDLRRTRIFDVDGVQVFGGDDGAPTEGGFLRASASVVGETEDGFQEELISSGGSRSPLLTLFPDDPSLPPISFFSSFPGNRPAMSASAHYADLIVPWVAGDLTPTHYSDYADSDNWSSDPWPAPVGGGTDAMPYRIPQ